jgi:hypothetical protein
MAPCIIVFYYFILNMAEKSIPRINIWNVKGIGEQLGSDLAAVPAAKESVDNGRMKVYHETVSDNIMEVGFHRRPQPAVRVSKT